MKRLISFILFWHWSCGFNISKFSAIWWHEWISTISIQLQPAWSFSLWANGNLHLWQPLVSFGYGDILADVQKRFCSLQAFQWAIWEIKELLYISQCCFGYVTNSPINFLSPVSQFHLPLLSCFPVSHLWFKGKKKNTFKVVFALLRSTLLWWIKWGMQAHNGRKYQGKKS